MGALWSSYIAFQALFRLITLSIVTYLMNADPSRHPRFEEISELFFSNEIVIVGYAALAYLGIWRFFTPIVRGILPHLRWSISPPTLPRTGSAAREFAQTLWPGMAQGLITATGILTALLLSGTYRYLGLFMQLDEAPLALLSFMLRAGAILSLCVCEEMVFRGTIFKMFQGKVALVLSVAATSFLYLAAKTAQFDFSWMQGVSLLLVSAALCVRIHSGDPLLRGAGFLAALLVLFHVCFSLPLFGSEFTGPILIKSSTIESELPELFARFLTGGAGGPFSSFAFQAILVVDILRHAVQHRRKG